ncbi:MAG: SurA N-terminal domain-containing protein [Hyphomonadaceae bacterium]
MLGLMKRLTQNKIFGPILIGIVILSMAVWGIEDIFSGSIGSNIIKAGDRGINQQQLDRKFENYLSNVRREQQGVALTRQEAVEQGLLDQIYNIERSRLTSLGYARQLGADASAAALTQEVRSIDAFNDPLTGEFNPVEYRAALGRNGISVDEFETDTQDRLTLDYLREGIEAATVAPTDLSRLQAIFDSEVRYATWLPIQNEALPAPDEPTEEELRAFYDQHLDAFQLPERRQLSLLSLSPEDFLHQAEMTEEEIVEYYEATKTSRLSTPDQRTFLEAIFTSEDAALEAFGRLAGGGELEAAPDVIVTIRTSTAEDVSNESFRTSMFAFGAQPGSVVGPYENNNNWVIGRLDEILPGTPKTLEESREEIRAAIAAEKAEIAFFTALNEFDNLIGEGLNLEQIGASFGTPVLSFAPVDNRGVTEDGTFIRQLAEAREALAEAFTIPAGTITQRFDGEVSTFLISNDAIIPQSTPPYEDVVERAKVGYETVRQSSALRTALDTVKSSVDTGLTTLEAEAAKYDSALETTTGLRRTAFDRTLPNTVLNAIFALDEGDSSIVQGRSPTEMILVKLERVERPEASELDVLAPISATRVADQLRDDILFAFEQELTEAVKVKTDDNAFGAYRASILEVQ